MQDTFIRPRVVYKNVNIETIKNDDIDELYDFYRKELKSWKRFIQLWCWRNQSSVISADERTIIARCGGKIVGSLGLVPQRLTVSGESINAVWQQDSLVSKEIRGQGVGKRLVEEGAKGVELVLAKGTSSAMYGLRKALGYKDVPNSDLLVRVLRPRAMDAIGVKTSAMEWGILALGKAIQSIGSLDESGKVIRKVDRFDIEFDEIANQNSKQNIIRPKKDKEWLNWRYTEAPGRRYKIFQNRHGAIVLNDAVGNGEGWIVDLIVDELKPNDAVPLSKWAIAHFESVGIERVYVFSTLSKRRRQLIRCGFLPIGRSPKFTYKRTDEAKFSPKILQGEWDFWHGDGDVELYM